MRREDKILALILAGGSSTRMGEFKPLMNLKGHTVVERAVSCFRNAGIIHIRVVAGSRASELIGVLEKLGVDYTINKNFEIGMFSSVLAGLSGITDQYTGMFLLPVDIPMVKSGTVETILGEYRKSGKGIIYPCFLGKRGHPPFISSEYFGKILSSDISGNLRSVLSLYEDDSIEVELVDQAVLMDVDTPDDFNEAIRYLDCRNAPSEDECAAILLKYKTPEPVINHGKTVREISCRIACLLNEKGRVTLDIGLIRAGALLHDIARDKKDHAAEGALILDQLGYPDVAKVIAGHMDIEFNADNPNLNETAIVYLADKLVQEDMFITLQDRFSESYKKFSAKPEAVRNIMKREKSSLLIKELVEKNTGISDIELFLREEKIF